MSPINIIISKNLRSSFIKQLLLLVLFKKSLHSNFIPTFPKVKGTFLREEYQSKCEKDIMKSYLKENQNNLSRVIKSLSKDKDSIVNMIGESFTLVLLKRISKEQYKHRMLSFQTKNEKLKCLIDSKIKNSNINNFSAPFINLSYHVLTEYGLKYCVIDRNKNVKKYLSAELETLAQQTSDYVETGKVENYHKLFWVYANIFLAIRTAKKITLITI